MRTSIYSKWQFLLLLFGTLLMVGCSEFIDNEKDLLPEETIDQRGYYYEGEISLYKAASDKKIYYIVRPMMYPFLYGHCIPVPLPDYASNIMVSLGENTVVEKESVIYTYKGKEYCADMPSEGTVEYYPGFSITRIAKDEFSVYINPYNTEGEISVVTSPIPHMVFDDSADRTDAFLKFESPADFNLPTEISIKFIPYTFLDNFRPIRQYHLIVC